MFYLQPCLNIFLKKEFCLKKWNTFNAKCKMRKQHDGNAWQKSDHGGKE